MRPSASRDYPEYDDEEKQEAARFLLSDFTSEKGHNASDDEHLHARPIIRGIADEDRLTTWIEVAKEHADRVAKVDRDELRQRLRELTVDEPVAFQRASEIDAGAEPAVADGGAVAEDSDDEQTHDEDDQDVMTYEDPAERESKYQDAYSIAKRHTDPESVREALQDEFDRDTRRPHVVDALEDRLQEVTA